MAAPSTAQCVEGSPALGPAPSAYRRLRDTITGPAIAASLAAAITDWRDDSPTRGMINEIHVGDARPAMLVLPIGVWHGLLAGRPATRER